MSLLASVQLDSAKEKGEWATAAKAPSFCVARQVVGAVLGIILCLIFACVELSIDYPQANDMMAVTCLISCFWAFEVVPLPVTSLFPVVLMPVFGIMSSSAASKAYGHWLIMLFVGAFMVDGAIIHTNLHKRVALAVLLKVGVKRPWVVLLTFMGLAWVLSMFCSNTATTVMLLPFAKSLLDTAKMQVKAAVTGKTSVAQAADGMSLSDKKLKDLRKFELGVLLGICYSATVGGIATLIGTAPNGVLAGQSILAGTVDFANWFAFAFPISLFMIVLVYLVLWIMYLRGVAIALDDSDLRQSYAELGPLSRDELVVGLVLLLQIIGFFIRPYALKALFPGINDSSVAIFTAILLFFIPSSRFPGESVMTWPSAQEHLPWGVLLLMGGGFAVADGFKSSKLTNFIGEAIGKEVPNMSPVGVVMIIVFVITFLTEVTSNTATANIMMPIMSSVAFDTLTHPYLLMLPSAVACSFAFMLPAATPPNLVVFASERVAIIDFIKTGLALNLSGALFGSLLLYAMADGVFGANSAFPQWACESAQDPPMSECVWVNKPGYIKGGWVQAQACVPNPASDPFDPSCTLINDAGRTLISYTNFLAGAATETIQ